MQLREILEICWNFMYYRGKKFFMIVYVAGYSCCVVNKAQNDAFYVAESFSKQGH